MLVRLFFFSIFVISLLVNVFAIVSFLDVFGLRLTDWNGIFSTFAYFYNDFALRLFRLTESYLQSLVGAQLLQQLPHILIFYFSTFVALLAGNLVFGSQGSAKSNLFRFGLTLVWMLSSVVVLFKVWRRRKIVGALREQSIVGSFLLALTVGSVSGAIWLNQFFTPFELDHRSYDVPKSTFKLWSDLFGKATKLRESGDLKSANEPSLEAVAFARREFGKEHPLTIKSIRVTAKLQQSLGQYFKAEALFESVLSARERILGTTDSETLVSVRDLGSINVDLGRYEKAKGYFNRVLMLQKSNLGSEHPETLITVSALADVKARQAEFEEAQMLFERVLKTMVSVLGRNHRKTLDTRRKLANLYRAQGKFDRAESMLLETARAMRFLLGDEHLVTLRIKNDLANHLSAHAGKLRESETLFESVIKSRTRILGAWHPHTIVSKHDLGAFFVGRGRLGDAEPLIFESFRRRRQILGEEHPRTLQSMNSVGDFFARLGRYSDAEPLLKEAWKSSERTLGSDHPITTTCLRNLADLYGAQGRFSESEPLLRRVLNMRIRTYGESHPVSIQSLNNLANLLGSQGRYSEATDVSERAVRLSEKSLAWRYMSVLQSKNGLARLYTAQGRYVEAEALFRNSLSLHEEFLGLEHPATIMNTNEVADFYGLQGRYTESKKLVARSLEISERVLGGSHPTTLRSKEITAKLFGVQKQYAKAESLFLNILSAREDTLGGEHPDTLGSIEDLADIYGVQGKYDVAEPLFLRCLEARENLLGANHPDTISSFARLANLYGAQNRFEESETLFRVAIERGGRVLGSEHPETLSYLNDLANLLLSQQKLNEAQEYFSIVVETLSEASFALGTDGIVAERVRLNQLKNSVLPRIVMALDSMNFDDLSRSNLLTSLFKAFQGINQTSVGGEILQAAERAALANPDLNLRTKELAQAVVDFRRIESEMSFVSKLVASAERSERMGVLRRELLAAEMEAKKLAERLRVDFPAYAELALPKAVPLDELQRLLQRDEAIVVYTFVGEGGDESLISLVLRADGSLTMQSSKLSRIAVGEKVRELRKGVELPSGAEFSPSYLAEELPFDLDLSIQIYRDLFQDLEPHLIGVSHIILVADGPLRSMPFNLLVRKKGVVDQSADIFHRYRSAEWLIDSYAISSLPSVSSIMALNSRLEPIGDKQFLGIGNPKLQGRRQLSSSLETTAASRLNRITLGNNEILNPKYVRELAPVPQTEVLLNDIASALGPDKALVLVQEDAEEIDLRDMQEDGEIFRYRTIAFATHALIANELSAVGLDEPALVLTPPVVDTKVFKPENDGLLRASEVVEFELDADWVLLTACNTAAADGTLGAEPLSGLAKSFFYAGARSLLVSHWPAEASAAARLAPEMIKQVNQGSSKAEALRSSMRSMKNDKNCGQNAPPSQMCLENAHPALWGAFAVIGNTKGRNAL